MCLRSFFTPHRGENYIFVSLKTLQSPNLEFYIHPVSDTRKIYPFGPVYRTFYMNIVIRELGLVVR